MGGEYTRGLPEGDELAALTMDQDMQDLIKQAFTHVEVIGPQVQQGNYDLIGPDGQIILPQIWDKVIEPDWSIEMKMWPANKRPEAQHGYPQGFPPMGHMPRPGTQQHNEWLRMRAAAHQARAAQAAGIPTRPGGGFPHGAQPPPPPHFRGRMPPPGGERVRGGPPPAGHIIEVSPPRSKKKATSGLAAWMAGGKPAKKK